MALQYNIINIDGVIIDENVSIEIINERLEGDVNIFWNDEGLVDRLKEEGVDLEDYQIIDAIEIEE